ncbi:M67 family metallopeptidase [Phormidium sp. CLA17]|uniref:Mov34/MPN/PAD-1 family protein n=1 Tax=Leptolyngbya sp. Cla-17 TaxID=2803751 RepID=UPI001490D3E9|nr:M67 family metallopeptidase [Leptolyngbya sp. Cla-17]MBM0741322.1 M67 family metallopeptidase [Leptolyngbya sp. Cla-17]
MTLSLSGDHIQVMNAHAERTYPEECCGLMLGTVEGDTDSSIRVVIELYPVENSWNQQVAADLHDQSSSKDRRYAIAPEDMLKAMRYTRSHRLDIIGIYHSHPDHPAVPSECDRRLAWQHYSYSIISVQQGKATEFYSWSLDVNHQFQPEVILQDTCHRYIAFS